MPFFPNVFVHSFSIYAIFSFNLLVHSLVEVQYAVIYFIPTNNLFSTPIYVILDTFSDPRLPFILLYRNTIKINGNELFCADRIFPLIYYCAKVLAESGESRLSPLDSARVCQPAEDQRGSPSGHHRDRTCSEHGPGPTGFAPPEACQRTLPRSSTVPSPLWGPAAQR